MVLLLTWQDVRDFFLWDGVRVLAIILVAFGADFSLHRLVPPLVRAAIEVHLVERPPEEREQRVHTLSQVFTGTGRAFILLVALLLILPVLGINIAPLLASASVIGLALGIAAQSLVRDLINGFFILMENQYAVGDVVQVAGVTGLVKEMSLRRTTLYDLRGSIHHVPHGEIRVVSNLTKNPSWLVLDVVLPPGADAKLWLEKLEGVARGLADDPYWKPVIVAGPKALPMTPVGHGEGLVKVLAEVQAQRSGELAKELERRIHDALKSATGEATEPPTTQGQVMGPKARRRSRNPLA